MVLRIVHAAVPPQKKEEYHRFINTVLAPAIRKSPGCRFIYVADCVEAGHANEVIYVSGWDSLSHCEELEATNIYQGAANEVRTFYTREFAEGAQHLHYETFAELR